MYHYGNEKLNPLYIDSHEVNSGNFLGFLELSKDEQIAKAIYEATGDKTFKGFLPLTWNTAQIVKMRDIAETLKAKGQLTALNMSYAFPAVSQAAHLYFIKNAEKIAPLLPSPVDIFKMLTPVLWIAGIAAGAYFLSQVKSVLPQKKGQKK